jgi:hypothetical protein
MSIRPSRHTDGNTFGMAALATTALATSPLERTTSCPLPRSVVTRCSSTRVEQVQVSQIGLEQAPQRLGGEQRGTRARHRQDTVQRPE